MTPWWSVQKPSRLGIRESERCHQARCHPVMVQQQLFLELGCGHLWYVEFALHSLMKIAIDRQAAWPFGHDRDDQGLAWIDVESLYPFPIRHDLVVFARDEQP